MSLHSIQQYQSEVEKIIHYGGSKKETAIRNAFYNLLNEYAKQKELMLIPEISVKGRLGKSVTPDGTLKDSLRQDWGYWESKDEADDIDEEIEKKFSKGYPNDNIIFEDSQTAILIQGGNEIARVPFDNADALDRVLKAFVSYERPEVQNFRKAIELFKADVPKVTDTLRALIDKQEKSNKKYLQARSEFFELCKEAINPAITLNDIIEMMIQHILTADIFNTIFDEPHFHRENNIAKELEKVVDTFFTGTTRRTALGSISHYYKTINAAGAGIADHHEKQKFLKAVYETFYKSYNPKAADRLGVVYTPNEIVRFMIESTDYLLHKHFGKFLEDKGVEILDPTTGTGTYICDIIDHIRKDKLEYKYKHELHANEVAILPYYIANLNIEFTYKQKMEAYSEFENLCFVDTLDNMGFSFKGKQDTLFGVSAENVQRIKRQNLKKISVVIGNPPYNANQQNENENNKNREYPNLDKRIKDTFIKYSNAQKTKVYDMYARFYRWSFDRLNENGIVAFITNRSFIDSRTFDGFRRCVQDDFDYGYIIDTKSDVRANPKIAGTTHNVFGIQTGVAIMLLVKKAKRDNEKCLIRYVAMDDFWKKEEKLHWLSSNPLKTIEFEKIQPDKKNNWINITDNNFESLLPLCSKEVKSGLNKEAIFELISNGIVTARDEWSYDFDISTLKNKAEFFCDFYAKEQNRWNKSNKKIPINDFVNRTIKFGSEIESHLIKGDKLKYDEGKITKSLFRPFIQTNFYFDRIYTHRIYQIDNIFGLDSNKTNKAITFLSIASSNEISCLCTNKVFDAGLLKQGNGLTSSVPYYRYTENGERVDNITNWSLQQFQQHYENKKITKEDIFHYVYAVLHHPAYRKKYQQNLKREFPRIPFYDNFRQWANWGKELLDLHINYEKVKKYPLNLVKVPNLGKINGKPKLKADKSAGTIELDEVTTLANIPVEAWEYKLGNRSALEWILDQYKESTPKDPTIREKFNTYKFSDYKKEVIDLLMRVCTVSVETVKIVEQMPKR